MRDRAEYLATVAAEACDSFTSPSPDHRSTSTQISGQGVPRTRDCSIHWNQSSSGASGIVFPAKHTKWASRRWMLRRLDTEADIHACRLENTDFLWQQTVRTVHAMMTTEDVSPTRPLAEPSISEVTESTTRLSNVRPLPVPSLFSCRSTFPHDHHRQQNV